MSAGCQGDLFVQVAHFACRPASGFQLSDTTGTLRGARNSLKANKSLRAEIERLSVRVRRAAICWASGCSWARFASRGAASLGRPAGRLDSLAGSRTLGAHSEARCGRTRRA